MSTEISGYESELETRNIYVMKATLNCQIVLTQQDIDILNCPTTNGFLDLPIVSLI